MQEQVRAYVAGRIMQRLAKLGASEEANLRQAVSASVQTQIAATATAERFQKTYRIPASVVTETIRHMANLGQLRRFRYNGVTFISTTDASTEELRSAMRRTFGTFKIDERTFAPATRRPEELLHFEQIHSSEEQDAYTAEGMTTSATDAELLPKLNAEERDLSPKSAPLSPEVQAKIRYQDKIGQGPRNTRRAIQRFYDSEEGRIYTAIKNAGAEQAKRDRAAYALA